MNKLQVKPTVAQVILQQLRATASRKMLCWGVHDFIGMPSGLRFRVSGLKHKGHVSVIYEQGSDTYKVQIAKIRKHEWIVKQEVTDVYCDTLGDVIDGLVEQ
ncbi:MAG: hypothetical protein KME05_10150 [Gloeocapsa sp. UFS-A4-WI-NPMV-4B04]|jgi:acid phosphatase family membrane protein YuiD|nr:hypothetical protein [Gloeocapsa sp. UFS-A4-WI-NPMV-4B04]